MSRTLKLGVAAIVLLAAFALNAQSWPWNADMMRQPSLPPYAGPRAPAPGTVPVSGEVPLERWQMEGFQNPRAGAAPTEAGRALFATYCVPCHGEGARGNGPVAKVFVQPRDLRDPSVQARPDGWFFGTIRNGANMMPRYGPEIGPSERWEIVNHLKRLGSIVP